MKIDNMILQILQHLQNFVKFQKFQLENLVDFEKCCKTHIFLQRSEPIQPKTSNILPKFCQPTLSDVAALGALAQRVELGVHEGPGAASTSGGATRPSLVPAGDINDPKSRGSRSLMFSARSGKFPFFMSAVNPHPTDTARPTSFLNLLFSECLLRIKKTARRSSGAEAR